MRVRRRRSFLQGIAPGVVALAAWISVSSAPRSLSAQPANSSAAPAASAPAPSTDESTPAEATSSPSSDEASAALSSEEGGEPLLSGTASSAVPWSERYFPFLADETEQGSISVGDTSYGYLIGARRVTESDALGILMRQRGRDLGYGTDQIVLLLEDAAAKFHERTGTRLWIGNIGRRGGGDIAYSVSHNSGRDADVALAYTGPNGASVDPPDLIQVDASGVPRDKDPRFRFDVARTWQIIKALVESDRAEIEFLFLARPLIEKVLRHAREAKEPVALIEKASALLFQPGGAPHDDHLHVRVYCSERDVEGGCLNTGPVRPWAHLHLPARARRIEKAVAALHSPEGEERARAIDRLVLLSASDQRDTVAPALDDSEPRVRAAAAYAIARWGGGEVAALLAQKLRAETDSLPRAAMMAALSDLGGPAAGELFAAELGRAGTLPWGRMTAAAYDPASPTPFLVLGEVLSPLPLLLPRLTVLGSTPGEPAYAMKLYIIDAAGLCDRPEPVEPMFALLSDADPEIRGRAAFALTRLLNRPIAAELSRPDVPADQRAKALDVLSTQISPLRRADRSPWVVEGFSRAGFKVPKIAAEHAWEILRAFGAGEPYSYNASRALTRIAMGASDEEESKKPERPPAFEETVAECRYWLKWIDARRGKLHLKKAPEGIGSACK